MLRDERKSEALEHYRAALRINPENRRARMMLDRLEKKPIR
jgi:hypothetical protein